jgi:DNA (cytosine-5)-methyltransferase 1
MRCLDLFAGAGGLSTGLEMAGFEPVFANEISPTYSKTLRASHPNTLIETNDVTEINARAIRHSLQLEQGELELLAGGPPCQGFSINAPVRSTMDKRNHLFNDFLRFTEEFKPKTILIENVPGMISFESGATIKNILSALSNLGYLADVRILFAPHYGVPQMRWRTIILGNRLGINPLLFYPNPTHSAKGRANFRTQLLGKKLILSHEDSQKTATERYVTVGDAISDLPVIENGAKVGPDHYYSQPQNPYQALIRSASGALTNHHCSSIGLVNLERLPFIPQGGSWRDIPFELLPSGMKRARRSDHTKRYGRLHLDELASTILTKCDPHWGAFIHPTQERVLSVREAARLQSFPDTVEFMGSITEQYEQVGNAVPPFFAKAIGNQISSILLKEPGCNNELNYEPSVWLDHQVALNI